MGLSFFLSFFLSFYLFPFPLFLSFSHSFFPFPSPFLPFFFLILSFLFTLSLAFPRQRRYPSHRSDYGQLQGRLLILFFLSYSLSFFLSFSHSFFPFPSPFIPFLFLILSFSFHSFSGVSQTT